MQWWVFPPMDGSTWAWLGHGVASLLPLPAALQSKSYWLGCDCSSKGCIPSETEKNANPIALDSDMLEALILLEVLIHFYTLYSSFLHSTKMKEPFKITE